MSGQSEKSKGLQAGPAIALVSDESLTWKGTLEERINARIRKIVDDAYGAGFITEIKSVTYGGGNYIILYELETDAGFHDPMQ